MIKVLLLKGCSRCEHLKKHLLENRIDHKESYCEDDPNICDYIESIIDSYEYPIILNINSKEEIKEIFYLTSEYNRIKENKILSDGINTLGFHSIDQLIKFIIK